MRIADKMAFDQVNRAVSQNRSEMSELQNQAATQKRVNKPSDDPVAASRVLFSRVEQRGIDQYIKNLNYARGFLDFTEQSLSELSEVLVRAKELAIGQANDASANPQTRRVVATEVAQLHDQAVQISNRKLGERFIFGGFKTTATPFDNNGTYKGDSGEMKVHVDKDSFLSMNMPGSQVFLGQGLTKDGQSSRSIVQARTLAELKEQKTQYPDRFQLPDGQSRQSINPHAQDSNPMRGPASVRTTENMAPKTEMSENREGEKTPQGINVFNTLRKFEVALSTDDKTGVQEAMDRIEDALQQVVIARTSLGSRVMAIDNTLNSLSSNNVDTKATISNLEDADAFQVISDINKTESALQATLQTSGKMFQKNLMDFIS